MTYEMSQASDQTLCDAVGFGSLAARADGRVIIRQVPGRRFVVVLRMPGDGPEVGLADRNAHDRLRVFTDLGQCVKAALAASGVKRIYFELAPKSPRSHVPQAQE